MGNIQDAGPSHDTRPNRAAGDTDPIPPYTPEKHLLPLALRAMYEWNPFNATVNYPRHYGSFRYGKVRTFNYSLLKFLSYQSFIPSQSNVRLTLNTSACRDISN